jgi:hypothetical protein
MKLKLVVQDIGRKLWYRQRSLTRIGFGALLGIVLILTLYGLPKLQVSRLANLSSEQRFQSENEARKTVAQIIGGAAFLLGFYFTWRQLTITQEGQITDRFTKAIAQLGDDKLAVRLGGIYALDRIARDSPKDHWPIVGVLTAYVREKKRENEPKAAQVQEAPPGCSPNVPDRTPRAALTIFDAPRWETWQLHLGPENRLASDTQAILTILTDIIRAARLPNPLLDLRGAFLRGLHLHAMSDLSSALLAGADLSRSYLALVNLSYADLDYADLSGAWLHAANLYPSGEPIFRG